jgi:hypothetical protein
MSPAQVAKEVGGVVLIILLALTSALALASCGERAEDNEPNVLDLSEDDSSEASNYPEATRGVDEPVADRRLEGADTADAVEAADQATPAVIRDEDLHDPLEGAGGEPPTPGAAEGEADETARVVEPDPEAPIDNTPY